MSEYTQLFERAAARYPEPDLSTDGLLLRRDDKRRNQRVAAGVLGIVVFAVAALGLVRLLGSERTPATLPTPAPQTSGGGGVQLGRVRRPVRRCVERPAVGVRGRAVRGGRDEPGLPR
jgi:hypothetical protein